MGKRAEDKKNIERKKTQNFENNGVLNSKE